MRWDTPTFPAPFVFICSSSWLSSLAVIATCLGLRSSSANGRPDPNMRTSTSSLPDDISLLPYNNITHSSVYLLTFTIYGKCICYFCCTSPEPDSMRASENEYFHRSKKLGSGYILDVYTEHPQYISSTHKHKQ